MAVRLYPCTTKTVSIGFLPKRIEVMAELSPQNDLAIRTSARMNLVFVGASAHIEAPKGLFFRLIGAPARTFRVNVRAYTRMQFRCSQNTGEDFVGCNSPSSATEVPSLVRRYKGRFVEW
jgi:hypothetical protein